MNKSIESELELMDGNDEESIQKIDQMDIPPVTLCKCGLSMYFSQDYDAYICECGNELELHNTLFSGDPITCEA